MAIPLLCDKYHITGDFLLFLLSFSISQPYKEITHLIYYKKAEAEKFKSCPIARIDKIEFKCEFPEPQNQSSFVLSHAALFHEARTT